MVSLRRLRAAILLALVSAVGWSLFGATFVVAYLAIRNGSLAIAVALEAVPWFAFFGLVAGFVYAVALSLSARWSQGRIGGLQGALLGGFGGAMLYLSLLVTLFSGAQGKVWLLLANFSVVGAATGFLIHRVAQRGALPPSGDAAEALEP